MAGLNRGKKTFLSSTYMPACSQSRSLPSWNLCLSQSSSAWSRHTLVSGLRSSARTFSPSATWSWPVNTKISKTRKNDVLALYLKRNRKSINNPVRHETSNQAQTTQFHNVINKYKKAQRPTFRSQIVLVEVFCQQCCVEAWGEQLPGGVVRVCQSFQEGNGLFTVSH